MNYIELINNFWELDEQWQFTCCETRLYFYLIKTANRLGWVNNWTHSDAKASANVGVSENSLKTARNKLIQSGLIGFKTGGKGYGDKNRYQILIPNLHPNQTPNLHPKPYPKPTPLYKLKLNETLSTNVDAKAFELNADFEKPPTKPSAPPKERKKVAPKKENLTDLSFVSTELLPIVEKWLRYKADKGQKYKSNESIKAMFAKLLKYSENDIGVATEIIDDAMAKNYSGFFELKKINHDNNGNSKPSPRKAIAPAQDADRESTI